MPPVIGIGVFVLVQAADWQWYTAWLILVGIAVAAAAGRVLLPALRSFQTLMDRITEGLGWIAKWIVPVLVLIAFTKVLFRYIGRWQNKQIVDIALLDQWQLHLFGYIFLLSLPYVLKNAINVRVDFLFQNYPPKVKAAIDFVGHIIGLIPFCLLAIWTTWDKTSTSLWRNARPQRLAAVAGVEGVGALRGHTRRPAARPRAVHDDRHVRAPAAPDVRRAGQALRRPGGQA